VRALKKGSGAWGRGREMCGHGRVHGGEHRRFGGTVPTCGAHITERTSEARGIERECARARRKLSPTSRPHRAARGREGEREREHARDGADRRGPPIREGRARVGDLGRLG
jgi:hypothetical protein